MDEDNTSYNLEIFEVFLISVPSTLRTAGYVAGMTALLLAVPAIHFLRGGATAAWLVWPLVPAMVAATVVGGETIRLLVAPYPREWGLFLAFVNQSLGTAVLILATAVGLGTAEAVTLAAGFMALNGIQVLVITISFRRWLRAFLASAIQPALFLAVLVGLELPMALTPAHVGLVVAVMLFVLLVAWLAEVIVAVNVDVRGLDYSSALTLDTPLDMGIGEPTRRPVQSLEVTNDSGPARIVAPWFHPGLMSKIGGGRMSRRITASLNREERGSFVKPPVSHKSDPADPAAVDDIVETIEVDGEGVERASRLIEHDLDGMTFRVRRYGDTRVVWFDSVRFDDVELPVYRDLIDPDNTIVVDCHAHEPDETRNLVAGTVDAERFRAGLTAALERVEDEPLQDYAAGFAAFDDAVPGFAFVERVDDQRTLVLGLDGNNVTADYRTLAADLEDRFDRVMLLTTDTHASPFEIDALPSVSAARAAVDEAEADCSPATARLGTAKTPELTILGDAYTKLMDSFNIGARFLIVSLGLSYLVLLAGVAGLAVLA